MSWKKNAFSCLIWLLYLLIVGTAMIFTCRVVCDSFGVAAYFEFVIPGIYLLITGIIVFLLHRMAVRLDVGSRRAGKGLAWIERVLVLALFAAGIFLRVTKLPSVPDESVYLKLAYISADGEGIPPFSHGAVYLYIWMLRLCFLLLGNKAAVAVWLQIALQMCSVLMLYFAVRKMAGRIPAVLMVSLFLFLPDMVRKSLECSPEMLFLLFFSLALLFLSRGVESVFGWEFWMVAGMMTGALSYLDVAGLLAVPVMFGVIVMKRPGAGSKIVRALCGSLAGFVMGVAGCFFADAIISGKPVSGIIRAWLKLYQWREIRLSVTLSGFDMVWPILLILCFMAWGIFSFWCGRRVERFTVWIFCLTIAILMQCLGMFTEEMNGFCYIFFFSTILAGLGIRESMVAYPAEDTGGMMPAEEGRNETAGGTYRGKDVAETEIEDLDQTLEIEDLTESGDEPGDEKTGDRCGKTKDGIQDSEEHTQNTGEEKGIVGEQDKADKKDTVKNADNTETTQTAEEQKNAEVGKQPEKRRIEFLENPLPLPKKHEKRVMDYKLDPSRDLGGYDVYVADDDDFDH